jgi:hypothetical protein
MPTHPFAMIVLAHLSRYPLMQPADLYKLAHQAALGSEHAVRSEAAARAWLERELAEMGSGPPEPLLDPISPDGRILRVHLRPYLLAGHDPEALLRAFVGSANPIRGGEKRLRSYLNAVSRLAEDGRIGIDAGELSVLIKEMQLAGWPAVHHSSSYQRAYRPAYRVVVRSLLPLSILS